MNTKYTSTTASLKTIVHDSHVIRTDKLFVKDKKADSTFTDIVEILNSKKFVDDRGENTGINDRWGTSVVTNENVVKIEHKWLSLNGVWSDENNSPVKLEYDKLYVGDEFHSYIQSDRVVEINNTPLQGETVSIETSLDNLKDGTNGFLGTTFLKTDFDLPSLEIGDGMFESATIVPSIFSKNLGKLKTGNRMFKSSKSFTDFQSNISNCFTAKSMFSGSTLKNFSGSLTYLYDGTAMFYNASLSSFNSSLSSLITGIGMFENTNLTRKSVEAIAYTLPSLTGQILIPHLVTDEDGSYVDYEAMETFANGVSFNYKLPSFDEDTSTFSSKITNLTINPENVGIITITWKNPSLISDNDKAVILHEYFELMRLKGWTIISNLVEQTPGKIYKRTFDEQNPINAELESYESVGTMIIGTKSDLWTETDAEA